MYETRPSDVNAAAPNVLERFIGQRHIIDTVRVALEASWNDGVRFPHALFVGPPGTGKSQLVEIVAKELGSTLRQTLAQNLTCHGDLHALLLEAEDRDCVFLDESDELDYSLTVVLYRAMAEGKLFLPRGRSNHTPEPLPLNNFTLILASNHEHKMPPALLSRFKLTCRFEHYAAQELALIVRERAATLRWEVEPAVFNSIAQLSRGIPRTGLRLLEAAWRTARSQNVSVITTDCFERTCQLEGLDPLGLDRTEQHYLRILTEAEGNPVRLGVIADRLGLPPRTLASVIEPFLVRENLILRHDQGRELTPKGLEHCRKQMRCRDE